MSDRVNLVPASPIECLLYYPSPAIQYRLEPERFTRLGNSNVPRLTVKSVKGLNSTVVNGTRHSTNGGSLKTKCTVPLSIYKRKFLYILTS